jgi:hypothetical protein
MLDCRVFADHMMMCVVRKFMMADDTWQQFWMVSLAILVN